MFLASYVSARPVEDRPSDPNTKARTLELSVACGPRRILPSERQRCGHEQDDSASGVDREEPLECSRRPARQASEQPPSLGWQRVWRCGLTMTLAQPREDAT
jgi:hypothetical protein